MVRGSFIIVLVLFKYISIRPRRTMDSIRVSEAPDTGSIPVEATTSSQISVSITCTSAKSCFVIKGLHVDVSSK